MSVKSIQDDIGGSHLDAAMQIIMHALEKQRGQSIEDLANSTNLSPESIGMILKRLEAGNYASPDNVTGGGTFRLTRYGKSIISHIAIPEPNRETVKIRKRAAAKTRENG